MLISTWSDKGGTGKTTMAILLGAFFKAKLFDLDPQADFHRWASKTKQDCVALPSRAQQALIAAAEDKAISIVDCPPGRSTISLQGMACSQIVVIPTRSGDSDLVALSRALDAVEIVRNNGNPGIIAAVVLNAFRDTSRALSLPKMLALTRNYTYIGEIKERIAYEESYANGDTVLDAPSSLAAIESTVVLNKVKELVDSRTRKVGRKR